MAARSPWMPFVAAVGAPLAAYALQTLLRPRVPADAVDLGIFACVAAMTTDDDRTPALRAPARACSRGARGRRPTR